MRIFRLIAAAAFVAIAAILVLPSPAFANEQITSFDVDIEIMPTGDLLITETIVYDFASTEKHGIFREIPRREKYLHAPRGIGPETYRDDSGSEHALDPDVAYWRIWDIHVDSVEAESPDTPVDFRLEESGDLLRIKIEDPDIEIVGEHTYTITYRVKGALNGFSDHDELFWDAIGTGWPVSINQASINVHAPAEIERVNCLVGVLESQLPCSNATTRSDDAEFTQVFLASYQGLTIVVALPKEAVIEPLPILDERWTIARAFSVNPVSVAGAGAAFIISLGGVIALVWGRGRDRRFSGGAVAAAFGSKSGQEEKVPLFGRTETPIEFSPPAGIRPGQMGLLVDTIANPLDVSATIVDLAVRGYLRIEETDAKGWFGKGDWKLTNLKSPSDLLAYERELHAGIFEDGDIVRVSALKRKFATRLSRVQASLYDDVTFSGWFRGNPDKVRNRWRLISAGALTVAVLVTVVVAAFTTYAMVSLPLIISALVLVICARNVPARSAQGTALAQRIKGFRRFIESPTESGYAQFNERQNLFSEYLPYAMVFGVTDKWADAFSSLGLQAVETSWYVSTHPLDFAGFGRSMDGFAVISSGSFAAQAASSGSGFSGGGGVGGGGGGGGGGSW